MHLITGIDPGTTTGIAALDFEGTVIELYSSKDLGLDKTIEHLVSLGTVSLVATDVNPPPSFVSKIATKLGAVLYVPKYSVGVSEKMDVTRAYKPDDAHQRDALAAALTAYASYKNKFAKIDSLYLGRYSGDVKHLVLHGHSIEKAKSMVCREPTGEPAKAPVSPKPVAKTPAEHSMRIRMLERQNLFLKNKLREKDEELCRLRLSIAKTRREYVSAMRRDPEIKKRESRIKSLKGDLADMRKRLYALESMKNLWESAAVGEIVPVGTYPKQKKGLVLIKKTLREDDAKSLEGIETAFTDLSENRRILQAKGVPTAETGSVREFRGIYYVPAAVIADIRKRVKQLPPGVSIEDIVEGYRRERI
ncbi:MAG: DUF460 domain-containing protein [Candidatus Altiarchaeota archaeon]|nr:DUF460 domain-containing protein [Candidatus Altiarchaeota archaeon]